MSLRCTNRVIYNSWRRRAGRGDAALESLISTAKPSAVTSKARQNPPPFRPPVRIPALHRRRASPVDPVCAMRIGPSSIPSSMPDSCAAHWRRHLRPARRRLGPVHLVAPIGRHSRRAPSRATRGQLAQTSRAIRALPPGVCVQCSFFPEGAVAVPAPMIRPSSLGAGRFAL
jgi:hypothetical protein